jgi:DNA-binding NtrC family response regulator
LLRVLQTGEFERLGSSTTRKVDVRIVSATNTDLTRAIQAGTFREDLYFRLNVIELPLPPLAERSEDIVPLSEHYLAELAGESTPLALTEDAVAALLGYEWPGNVRELQNRLQRASLVCRDGSIRATDLALPKPEKKLHSERTSDLPTHPDKPSTDLKPRTSCSPGAEREQIEEALSRAQGIVSKAAAELGLSRQALYRRMERLGLSVERRIRD